MDQVDDLYQKSILSIEYASCSFRMGTKAISNLLHGLGIRGNGVRVFEQALIDENSGNVAIDGHMIRSCSGENCLAEPGYKIKELKADQANLLIAYDIGSHIPLMYRTYKGSCVDKSSALTFLKSREFHNTKVIADRGFYSASVIELMSQNGNTYIISLPSTTKTSKKIRKSLVFSSGEFIYTEDKKNSANIVYYEEKLDEKTRVIVYKDEDENNSKRKNYLRLLGLGEDGYSMENYEKYSPWWGVYFLQTTAADSASDIFRDYKGRWSIETYNNYLKNDAAFNNLKIQDYYIEQGFNFIMFVTGLIHSKLNDAVKALDNSSISTIDILIKAGMMRMVKNKDGVWTFSEHKSERSCSFGEVGFSSFSNLLSSKIALSQLICTERALIVFNRYFFM